MGRNVQHPFLGRPYQWDLCVHLQQLPALRHAGGFAALRRLRDRPLRVPLTDRLHGPATAALPDAAHHRSGPPDGQDRSNGDTAEPRLVPSANQLYKRSHLTCWVVRRSGVHGHPSLPKTVVPRGLTPCDTMPDCPWAKLYAGGRQVRAGRPLRAAPATTAAGDSRKPALRRLDYRRRTCARESAAACLPARTYRHLRVSAVRTGHSRDA